ncbi:MAG: alpha-2-macroglobulin family protein [Candidatus Gracilibacteria bacterium]|nr:alpha-2-macroglobulin family protein [Candidatus Gracilibacteria bacterium]
MYYFIHDIKSYSDKIIVDVLDTYYPNYYVKAFLIGEQQNNPLPVYKRALAITKVNTDYKKLNVEIKTNKKDYLPGAVVAMEIKVTDYKGNPVPNADLSVSLVDESLLALKGNPKKNPYAFFYDLKRYLGITTYSSLKNLIEKLEVKNSNNGEKGGAGETTKGGDSKKKRGTFKDTAFWQANVSTDKNGIAKINSSKLPDNLTTWVIETLANTASDTKVGVNYETIITSKKLLISDNLPRFFGSNDTIILSPVVFNKTGKDQTFKVELDITNAKITGKNLKILQ